MTSKPPLHHRHLPLLGLALIGALPLAGCGDRQGTPKNEAISAETAVGASRVAADAGTVVSRTQVEFDRVVLVGEEGEAGLRLFGDVSNKGSEPVTGAELSLSFDLRNVGTVGGTVVQAYFVPPVAPGERVAIQIDTALPGGRPLEPADLAVRTSVLRTLRGSTPHPDRVVTGRTEAEPYLLRRKVEHGQGSASEVSDAEASGVVLEKVDGDKQHAEGDGG